MDSNVSAISPEVLKLRRERGQQILALNDWMQVERQADLQGIAGHVQGIEMAASLLQERIGTFDDASIRIGLLALSNTQPLLLYTKDESQDRIDRALARANGTRTSRF
jgi:hypothetical protein